jgi:hypothetical protein
MERTGLEPVTSCQTRLPRRKPEVGEGAVAVVVEHHPDHLAIALNKSGPQERAGLCAQEGGGVRRDFSTSYIRSIAIWMNAT